MTDYLPIAISSFALLVSMVTAWLSFFRVGKLRMTQPTVIFLGPDGGSDQHLKVFIRTLLYSTSKRGQIVENLYVTLQRGESRQSFPIWTYGEKQLARGSGLFVPQEGLACNHHFLLPEDGTRFQFLAGEYVLQVFAKRTIDSIGKRIGIAKFTVSGEQSKELENLETGIYFDWGAEQQTYHSHIDKRQSSQRGEK